MSSSPPFLVPVTRARRFSAGLLNFLSVGFAVSLSDLIVTGSLMPPGNVPSQRFWTMGFISALWLFCVVKKMSLGSLLCVLEIRSRTGDRPSLKQMLARSAPIYTSAVVMVFPIECLPRLLAIAWPLVFLLVALAVLANAVAAAITGLSFLDRLSKTVVLQVKLPDHMKPRLFGIRVV